MKVISGSDIDELIDEITTGTMGYHCQFEAEDILRYVKEIDTLTVSKLRPMADASIGNSVLVIFNGGSVFYSAYIKTSQFLTIDDEQFRIDLFQGWIPMPKFIP